MAPPILVTLRGMVIEVRDVHPKNARGLIVVTPSGIVTLSSFEHDSNIEYSMVPKLFEMVSEARLVQSWNTLIPVSVTLLGIMTEVRPVQPLNE